MKKYKLPILFFLVLIALCAGTCVHAAQITAATSAGEVAPGGSFTITISMTTDQNSVNVVQGAIDIPSGVVVEGASTAGSTFTLWPTTPIYVAANDEVQFSGGVPGGVAPSTTVKLFTIEAKAPNAGIYTFAPISIQAYQNDGKGTAEPVTIQSASITIRAGAPASAVAPTGAAQPLVATVGRDPSLYGGKYFVAFYGGDRGDGVLDYEIQQGNGPFVTTMNRYYVLPKQTLNEDIIVRAMDANGVAAQTIIKGQHSFALLVWIVILVLVAAIVISGTFLLGKKQRS